MLAVDIGNTHTRAILFSGEDAIDRRTLPTRDLRADELRAVFAELAARGRCGTAWIASVAPRVDQLVDSAAGQAGLARRFIRSGYDPVIPHSLKTPETAGVDRLLAAMAAGERLFPGAAGGRGYVTVQCGSAATIDFVDGGGVFRGGFILPGPAMWLGGLATAARLPDLSAETPDWDEVAIGDNTRDAILRGMAAALPLAVAAAADMAAGSTPGRAGGEDREGPPAAITGGWGEAVSRRFPARFVHARDLVAHGIRLFALREGAR